MIDAQKELAALLGDRLPADWRTAYEANPRHEFLPGRVWTDVDVPLDRDRDPDAWLTHAYRDEPVITQLHDGAEGSDNGYPISSSCSMPSVVFTMLGQLGGHLGHRVLEIGTGTGWNAALLGSRLGDDQVVTIEYDAALADRARVTLARTGHKAITVVTGDGAAGHPDRAPYDRVVATCSVESVPYSWVEQTRPGGVILTPWGPTFENSGLLRLTVDAAGNSAHGRIVDWANFMRLRAQRPVIRDEPADFDQIADRAPFDAIDIEEFLSDGARLGIGLHVPDTRVWMDTTGDELEALWLLAPAAWAVVRDGEVWQAGDRRLWDEAVVGYRWWGQAGRPTRDRYGVTVSASGQTVWLDEPAAIVA